MVVPPLFLLRGLEIASYCWESLSKERVQPQCSHQHGHCHQKHDSGRPPGMGSHKGSIPFSALLRGHAPAALHCKGSCPLPGHSYLWPVLRCRGILRQPSSGKMILHHWQAPSRGGRSCSRKSTIPSLIGVSLAQRLLQDGLLW